jgi:hypothetical protein
MSKIHKVYDSYILVAKYYFAFLAFSSKIETFNLGKKIHLIAWIENI